MGVGGHINMLKSHKDGLGGHTSMMLAVIVTR